MAEPETETKPEAEAEPELEPDPISVRYEMNAQSRFFLCRFCGNHVVTMDNCIVGVEGTDVNGIICRNPVNVEHDDTMSHSFLNRLPAVNVRCNACNKYIGEKFVGLTPPCPRVMEGSYLLQTVLSVSSKYSKCDTGSIIAVGFGSFSAVKKPVDISVVYNSSFFMFNNASSNWLLAFFVFASFNTD
ncbi:hypothetical protein J1N35_008658 [Gossypium stocksii]|uniref:Yippee domain-containing protein n=1 Tax=Gossypium stocksii TaxID=47602 RepID=A0A9D3WAR0_9ROSI|nr:hypothetical protein J1N35_008658 [Gossypium stocksii]